MKIHLSEKETIIKKGYANLYESSIVNVGKLYLTNQQLFFITNPLNFRKFSFFIPLNEISSVELKNNLKIFSHGLSINLNNEDQFHFALWRRKNWKKLIEQHIASHQ